MSDTAADPDDSELQRLRAVFDALPSHLCVLDEQGTILAVNAAWRRFGAENGGNSASAAEGSNYLGVCGVAVGAESEQAQSFGGQLRRLIGGEIERFELEYPCHAPHERRWYVAAAMRIGGPGPARVLVSHEPVTARKLEHARLRDSERLETLGSLAGGIAHDFNNVLGSILGNLQLVQGLAPPGSDAAQALERVRQASLHARDLVRRILAFSRRQPRAPAVQDLRQLVQEAVALLRSGQPAAVTLTLDLPPAPIWALADAGEVQQVLVNLSTNAFHALEGRQGRVDIALDRLSVGSAEADALGQGVASGAHARLSVRDNGCGMDPATAERAFEPLFTTRAQGTGLGLALVRSVVQRMGGAVRFETEPGRGTRFEVLLPLVAAPAARTAARAGAAGLPLRGQVLVLDDDVVMGLTTQALLQAAGHRVTLHTSAHSALAQLAAAIEPFDLLVTDQRMPEMSGLDFVAALRAQGLGVPVLLLSGWIDDTMRERAIALGVRAVVPKEEAFERLGLAVQQALAEPPPAAQDSRFTPGSSQA